MHDLHSGIAPPVAEHLLHFTAPIALVEFYFREIPGEVVFLRPLSLDCLGNTKEEEEGWNISLRVRIRREEDHAKSRWFKRRGGNRREGAAGRKRKGNALLLLHRLCLPPSTMKKPLPILGGKSPSNYNYR